MDGGSSLNLLYQDTVRKMGIDPSRIKPSKTTFKGVIPSVEAHCPSSITLEVVFGSPDNFRSEELIFDIVPFRSGYHALSEGQHLQNSMQCRITHTSSSRCQALVESSRSTEIRNAPSERRNRQRLSQQKYKAAFFSSPAVQKPDTAKRARSNLQHDRLERSKQA